MFRVRCDVCSHEVEAPQPNIYPLDPDGWWGTLDPNVTKGFRRTAPHACSQSCAQTLIDAGHALMKIDGAARSAANAARKAIKAAERKGSVGCSVCRRIGTGKRCMFHGLKPEGWPLVTADGGTP